MFERGKRFGEGAKPPLFLTPLSCPHKVWFPPIFQAGEGTQG